MKILNLSKPFKMPAGNAIRFEAFIFNGGEPHIKLELDDTIDPQEEILITQRICSSDDLILLLLATDALRRSGYKKISVFIPYFPAARQDRVMVPGEPLSVKVYADIINAQQYERVIIFDPHSDVTAALLNNVKIITNEYFIKMVVEEIGDENICLIAPDAGAVKKAHSLAMKLNIQTIITCEKTRNVSNGKLSDFKVHADNLNNKTCLIVDDICDGGRTFIGIANELKNKNAGPVFLAVSHGIFSGGLDKFNGILDGVFTTDSFREIKNKNVKQFELAKTFQVLKTYDTYIDGQPAPAGRPCL
ncbi:MAG TPA: ribose-phosphate pyrophosphokinase [Bacteroidetes bacterium]|nr:ribose-phosphate pyrophosphokinase [Bacteroidota bacterium]